MEQKEFEAAIAKYATRKPDSVMPEFEIVLNNRHQQIDIRTQSEIKIRKPRTPDPNARKVITPDGTFNSVAATAAYYKKSVVWAYNQLNKTKTFTYDS